MRYRLSFALLSVLLLVSACNLGASEPDTSEPINNTPVITDQPQITIVSPNNGDQFVVNEQILVTIHATDPVGVTRVQLFADGIIVKTISSQSITGDQQFDGVLDFTPRVEGNYTLRVVAFRGAVASDGDEITVTVGQDQIVVTERPNQTSGPIIPNDGLCRVLINVNLNFRTEPTTTRDNVISVLAGGTLALVVARLPDYSWWKINVNNRIGWVSGSSQFTTSYGNCGTVPVENAIVNTPTFTPSPTSTATATITPRPTSTPGPPDLIVPTFVGDLSVIIPSGETEVTAEYSITIKNQGSRPSGQFMVEVHIEDDLAYTSVIGSIGPGAIITHTFELTFTAAGEYNVRVDVDPDDEVEEQIEVNNRADITVTVTNQ